MNFKQTVRQETDRKYVQMLDSSTPSPYKGELELDESRTYSSKRDRYYNRLSQEKSEFNNALNKVLDTENARLKAENDALEAKAYIKYKIFKAIKTAIFALPILLALVTGIDIFSNLSDYKDEVGHGLFIFGWVVFACACIATSVYLVYSLYKKEIYYNRKTIDGSKKYWMLSVIVLIVVLAICSINLIVNLTYQAEDVEGFNLNTKMVLDGWEENGITSDNEETIQKCYTAYKKLSAWQKFIYEDNDRFLEMIEEYNKYKADALRAELEKITPDTVSEEGLLKNTIAIYKALTDKQRDLLTSDEIAHITALTEVNVVVERIFVINDDIVAQYNTIDQLEAKYQALSDEYKAYVYNYYLVAEFDDRYEYMGNLVFVMVTGGYAVAAKEGVTISGELIIPSSFRGEPVVTIQNGGFQNQPVTSVIVPNSVTQIGLGAFVNCNSLVEITIPFVGKSIASTETKWTTFGYIFGEGLTDTQMTTSSSDYKTSDINSNYTVQNTYAFLIPESLKKVTITNQSTIPAYAFINCDLIEEILCESAVSTIGNYAFSNCTSLKEFDFPEGINAIGECAFKDCTMIKEVVFPNSVTSIGSCAFMNCAGITEITVPSSVTYIGFGAFGGIHRLEEITIPYVGSTPTTETPRYRVFGFIFGDGNTDNYMTSSSTEYKTSDTSSYTSQQSYWFLIPDSLKKVTITNQSSIPSNAFYNCDLIESITLAKDVTSIGDGAFTNCSALKEVHITDLASWCNISFAAFTSNPLSIYGSKLYINGELVTKLEIPSTVTQIGDYAFYNLSSITSVTIPNSIDTIGDSAFAGCSALKEIHITDLTSWCDISFESFSSNPLSIYGSGLYLNGELVTKLEIPSTVTQIKDYAFFNYDLLTSLMLPDSITTIGTEAFWSCNTLMSVTVPDSVTSIGEEAFYLCNKLAEVYNLTSFTITAGSEDNGYMGYYAKVIHTSLDEASIFETVGDYTFMTWNDSYYLMKYEGNDTEITLPESYKESGYSIYQFAFYNNDSIINVIIPECVAVIGNSAFDDCDALSNITIPNSVTSIAKSAFYSCSSLKKIVIPDNVMSIGKWAFYNCDALEDVTIGNGVTTIGDNAFYDSDGLVEIVIPNSVTKIGKYAFAYCSSLERITISKNASSIASNAFYSCANIKEATMPTYAISYIPQTNLRIVTINGGSSIPNSAFSGCNSLVRVTIGSSISSIGSYAFNNCNNLVEVYDLSSSISVYKGSTASGYIGYYAKVVHTSSEASSILEIVGDYTFMTWNDSYYLMGYEGNDTEITLPESYKESGYSIYQYAFYDKNHITKVVIPEGVTAIGTYSFYNCDSLTSITIPNSVTSIGTYSFYDCDSLTSITIPNSVTSIGSSAFGESTAIKEAIMPTNAIAFIPKNSLQTVVINGGSTIPESSFGNCGSLRSVTIGDSVTLIEKSAFSNCDSLKTVVIGKGVTSIGDSAFYDCDALSNVTIPDNVTSIGNAAFYSCSAFKTVTIPNSVTIVGSYAFSYCESLTTINCEATSKPSGWASYWNDNCSATVTWGYTEPKN